MSPAEKSSYFKKLTLNLRHEGFAVGPEENGLLPVALDNRHLCLAVESGGVRYRKKDVSSDSRQEALDRATAITKTTAEYMRQMEAAPQLGVGPQGDYRLLADFNDIVLAGHPTQYGLQFVTWERVQKGTALNLEPFYITSQKKRQ